MTEHPRGPRRERALPATARAMLMGALAGAALGGAEAALVLASGEARYAAWAAATAAIATLGYAAAGALLAVPAAWAALALWRRPEHRAAPASACAGLGTALGLAAFIASGAIGTALLVPAVLGGTLLCLALRELLAWVPSLARPSTFWGLAALALAANAALAASRGSGATAGIAFALAAAGTVVALAAKPLSRRAGRPATALLGLALPAAALFALARSPFPSSSPQPAGAAGAGGPAGTAPSSERRNVLLVTIDTLRADRLGCYGHPTASTPAIDRLASEAVLFEDATAQSNTTGPSHTTMLTGLTPPEHGAMENGRPLSPQVETIADLLAERGWSTAAFVSGFTLVDEACGLAPRFHFYDDRLLRWRWMPQACEELRLAQTAFHLAWRLTGLWPQRSDRPAGETIDAALAWLAERGEGEPFFLWVHLYDPHAPYEPPPPYDRLHDPDYEPERSFDWYELSTQQRAELVRDERALRHMNALYDGEISYADDQVGRLLDHLRERGLYDRALIALASDHGEGLGSHGYWFDHGTFLYDEELRVPLLLRLPSGERAGERVASQVRLLDLAPTLLEVLEVDGPKTSGWSLLPLLAAGEAGGDQPARPARTERPSYAVADVGGWVSGFDMAGMRLSLRAEDRKLIWTSEHWIDTRRVPPRWELYDLQNDPGELRDLLDAPEPPADDPLRQQLEAWRDLCESVGEDGELSPEVLAHLRALGYL